jgi:hypothetical protein
VGREGGKERKKEGMQEGPEQTERTEETERKKLNDRNERNELNEGLGQTDTKDKTIGNRK